MDHAAEFDCDLVIAGGGLVGLALACAMAGTGISVTVIDALDPAEASGEAFDGRVSALGRASCRLLQATHIWPHLQGDAQPILDIKVTDGRPGNNSQAGPSMFGLHFDHREGSDEPLGHMIENRILRNAQYAAVSDLPNIRLIAPARVAQATADPQGITVRLSDGAEIRARLCVAAEGRNSPLRESAGIRTIRWSYRQSGIVTTVAHELPHQGVAHEYFLPGGPFAILPMTGNRSSLVWTEPTARADLLSQLPQAAFDTEIGRRFGDHRGDVRSEGPRWTYPLSFHHARTYFADRLVLVGDAAHGIHPIAGQGLNLGLRDAAALAELVVDTHRLGLDIGVPTVLQAYEVWRRFDNVTLAAATDLLNRLFSNDVAPVRLARDLGMSVVNRIGPARRFFMRHAAGEVGRLPRLLAGKTL